LADYNNFFRLLVNQISKLDTQRVAFKDNRQINYHNLDLYRDCGKFSLINTVIKDDC
jgi:hypothetical protein